jgi:dinuclear metal center YbgI/SA1388 family protein
MSKNRPRQRNRKVDDFCQAMEAIASTQLAQSWDNVGLIAGDRAALLRRVLLCVDLSPPVVQEAVARRADLVMAYHPPILNPVTSLRPDGPGAESAVYHCIRRGIAVYSTHTALDAAAGGTNDALAALCGIERCEPLLYAEPIVGQDYKVVVFVPESALEQVAQAMFASGAGRIGEYTHCSFRASGTGTFFGSQTTKPAVGKRGRLEHVAEVRLETIIPSSALPGVVRGMLQAHPYEEPAFDLYPLGSRPKPGIGRIGSLPRPATLGALATRLRKATKAACVQIVGPAARKIERAIVVAGSAGDLPFRVPLTPCGGAISSRDVIVTGEMRHHDALRVLRIGCSAIVLGHWASERPVLRPLAERLRAALPNVSFHLSDSDRDPFACG